jgi:hypothetical protein
VRGASHAGVDLAANRPLDVRPGVAVHLSHRDRGQDGEGHEDNAGHSRDLEVLIHAYQHTDLGPFGESLQRQGEVSGVGQGRARWHGQQLSLELANRLTVRV